MLSESVKAYKDNSLSHEEQPIITSIENVRSEMLQSTDTIPKTEFGAGSIVLKHQNVATELVRNVCRTSSKPKKSCLLLYHLIRTLKPKYAIELGTCLGISIAYQAAALKHHESGKIISFEGSEGRAKIAEENLNKLSLQDRAKVIQGRFEDNLENQLNKFDFIDYAFIDGHHEEEATIKYFNELLPHFKKGGIMVFDDIFWSKGMNRAWKRIKNSGKFEITLEYKGMGLAIIS